MSYVIFSKQIPQLEKEIPTLNYAFVPIVVVIIGTFVIVSAFFNVYTMAVDTLLLCVLEDLERNDGSKERPYFMSKGLMKVLGIVNEEPRSRYSFNPRSGAPKIQDFLKYLLFAFNI